MNPTAYRYQACFWSSDSHLWLQLRKKGPVCQGFANWNDRQGHENRRIPAAVYGRGWKVFNENMRRPVKFWGLRFPRSAPLQKKRVALNHPFFVGIFHKPSTHFDFGTNSSGHLQPNSRAAIWFGDLGIGSGLVILKDENLHLFRIIHRKMLQNSPRRGRKLNSNPRIVGYCWYQLLLNVMGGYYKSSS